MKDLSISLGGWSIKNNKKRAYTLIELIAVISISAIIMAIGLTLIISSYKNYITLKEKAILADKVDSSLISIDRLLTGYMIMEIRANSDNNTNDHIDDNKITINYLIKHNEINTKQKVIKRKSENLIVETYIDGQYKNTMTILKKVKDFIIIRKENLYYYRIVFKNGEEIIRCI